MLDEYNNPVRKYAVVEVQEPDSKDRIVVLLSNWLKNVFPAAGNTFEGDCPFPNPFDDKKIALKVESEEDADPCWQILHVTIFSFTSKNTNNLVLKRLIIKFFR